MGLLGCFVSLASAQNFPDRPIRIVVPYVPGGSTDLLSRLLADTASETLRQNVMVENRPGAGGMLGTTPEQMAAHIRVELEKWAQVIKANNIRVE